MHVNDIMSLTLRGDLSPLIWYETLVPHLVATLIYLSQIYLYYIRSDRSPLTHKPLSLVITVSYLNFRPLEGVSR